MPRKDPDEKREYQRAWLQRKLAEGYGKVLYEARKRHFDNEKILRAAVSDAIGLLADADGAKSMKALRSWVREAEDVLTQALVDAPPVVRTPRDVMKDKKHGSRHR